MPKRKIPAPISIDAGAKEAVRKIHAHLAPHDPSVAQLDPNDPVNALAILSKGAQAGAVDKDGNLNLTVED